MRGDALARDLDALAQKIKSSSPIAVRTWRVQYRQMTAILPRRRVATCVAAALLSLVILVAGAARADAQATRTWVSGVGDDANPCSRTAPCKTLAGTIGKTAVGGEINALDPGGFGAVTIAKAITIDLSAAGTGGVLNSLTNGINVNAGPNDDVVLRGLDIQGAGGGTPTCSYNGLNGVNILAARSVRIDDTTIGRQATAVRIAPGSGNVDVSLNGVDIANNCTAGINAQPGAGGTANVGVRGVTITNSGTALRAADGAHMWVEGSTIFDNALAFEPVGTGVIDSFGDNRVYGNGNNGTPTNILNVAQPGPPGPAGPAGPAGPSAPSAPVAQAERTYKLLVALPSKGLTARVGKGIRVDYLSTDAAAATLEIRKGSRVIARVKAAARSGRNTIKWSGKAGRKKVAAGKYTLKLSAKAADGQTATSNTKLTLKR
jgi:hypothetical protein